MRFFSAHLHVEREMTRLIDAAEERLTELKLPVAENLDELLTGIGRRRNRPIHLIPLALNSSAPSGLWFALEESDLIVHESETTRTHREHIIAHELSHLLCGHDSGPVGEQDVLSLLFPDLEPALVRTMLSRSGYSDRHEAEAEIMASLVLRRVRARSRRPQASTPPEQVDIATRLDGSFRSSRGAAG